MTDLRATTLFSEGTGPGPGGAEPQRLCALCPGGGGLRGPWVGRGWPAPPGTAQSLRAEHRGRPRGLPHSPAHTLNC